VPNFLFLILIENYKLYFFGTDNFYLFILQE